MKAIFVGDEKQYDVQRLTFSLTEVNGTHGSKSSSSYACRHIIPIYVEDKLHRVLFQVKWEWGEGG